MHLFNKKGIIGEEKTVRVRGTSLEGETNAELGVGGELHPNFEIEGAQSPKRGLRNEVMGVWSLSPHAQGERDPTASGTMVSIFGHKRILVLGMFSPTHEHLTRRAVIRQENNTQWTKVPELHQEGPGKPPRKELPRRVTKR